MKKKIMLIVPMLHQGGFERVCVATARLLDPFYEVYIVMFDSRDIAYDIKGLNVIDLHLGVKKDILAKCLNVLKRSRAVRKLKSKLSVDIAYSFGPTANMVNVFSGGKEKIWVGIRSYMDMSDRRKLRLFVKDADRVLCCSGIIEDEMQTVYGCRNAVTLYNPLDTENMQKMAGQEEARLPWENREHMIASMGREDDVKGFWHLVKSFSLVRRQIKDAKLMIIGEGNFEEYRELAAQLGIGDAVYFTGMKKNPFPYLAAAQIYVLTSYNEGFPNALIEAMALGKPVIATDCMTGPREILLKESEKKLLKTEGSMTHTVYGDYGVLVPNMDPVKNLDAGLVTEEERNLAKEMILLLTDEQTCGKYGRAALERAGAFSDENYLEVIRKLIET